MKVLILTYYFPPAGGSGVQRWLKFVKYLPEFGINPIVYTVQNPSYPIMDESLVNEIPKGTEIIRKPIFEPNKLTSFFGSKKNQSAGFLNQKPSFFGKVMQYIRANYFIPDARKFWIKPSVKFLTDYITKNNIDTIITTGPPHTMHVIGLHLKEKNKVKWIADFRDPWTDIDYFHQLPLTKKAIKKHHQLEQQVLQNADNVIVVGKTMQTNYLKFNKKTSVITNGFDTFNETKKMDLDKKFSLLHIGMLNSDRNHIILWKVLSELINENENFKKDLEIKLIGKISNDTFESLHTYQLSKHLKHINYVKHNEVVIYQKSAQILLLLINNVPSAKGIITGKIFEYLNAKRPILAIAPKNGDLAKIISNTNSGYVIDFTDEINLKKTILTLYQKYKKNTLAVQSINIEQYHRKNLTKKLVAIIKNN